MLQDDANFQRALIARNAWLCAVCAKVIKNYEARRRPLCDQCESRYSPPRSVT